VPFDLSEVFFLATANLLDTIPAALRDRLEVIRIGGYTRGEKLEIARKHLVPRAVREAGLKPEHARFTNNGLLHVIDGYTREAGLRELDRSLRAVCRKVATRHVEGDCAPVRVGKQLVRSFLGPTRYRGELAGRSPEVGVVTGLAWTAYGGALLAVEATRVQGRGNILVTGLLGEVMRESAQAALSYIRSRWRELGLEKEFYHKLDIHIHVPEGAIPKDGPSAGITMATALASALTGRCVDRNLAMTGEITLRGRVLAIGGLKEKLLAARRAGIGRVLIPQENEKNLEEVPPQILKSLQVIPVAHMDDVLAEALLPGEELPAAETAGLYQAETGTEELVRH
jgi:ATP-dependent Lon protease